MQTNTPNAAELRAGEAAMHAVYHTDDASHTGIAIRASLHLDEVREAIRDAADWHSKCPYGSLTQHRKLQQALKFLSE